MRLSMNRPACVKSTTPISETIPVVKKMKINWLHIEGYIVCNVRGRTIL